MKSVSTKRFEIGYDLVENDRIEPVFTLTDLNIDKVASLCFFYF
jgi:hypothetical protein